MKSTKAKLAKKLKSIKPVDYLKQQERVLRVLTAADGLVEFIPKITNSIKAADGLVEFIPKFTNSIKGSIIEPVRKEPEKKEEEKNEKIERIAISTVQEPETIDVSELMGDLEDEEDDKENVRPLGEADDSVVSCGESNAEISGEPDTGYLRKVSPLSETNLTDFRRPDLNSSSLFDPNLLLAFEEAVNEYRRASEIERRARIKHKKFDREQDKLGTEEKTEEKTEERLNEEAELPSKTRRVDENENANDGLLEFEERCPPGGEGSVIFYVTTLRGIRKTFDDCNKIRFLLDSFQVLYYERDVSMHKEYKEELRNTMGGKAVLPVLFIKGRCIGGAQEVLGLHEQGKLRVLFQGVPVLGPDSRCESCDGVRFVVCFNCNGSHKVVLDNGLRSECLVCNENGLIVCPHCC